MKDIKGREGHKRAWRWRIYGDNAREFLRVMLPYLEEKQKQARVLLEIDRADHKGNQMGFLLDELKELKRSVIEV